MSNVANDVQLKDQFFLMGIGLATSSLMALFFLGISWVIGGDAFFESLYGKQTMLALLISTGAGTALALALRDKPAQTQHSGNLHTSSSAA